MSKRKVSHDLAKDLIDFCKLFYSRKAIVFFIFVFAILVSYAYTNRVNDTIRENLDMLAKTLSNQYQHEVTGYVETVAYIAANTVRDFNLNNEDCDDYLKMVHFDNNDLVAISVFDGDGNLKCSSTEHSSVSVNISDRAYFNRAIKTKGFVSGGYIMGRLTNEGQVAFAYPLFDENQKLSSLVMAGYSPSSGVKYLKDLDLNNGTEIYFVDSSGTTIVSYPYSTMQGKQFKNLEIFNQAINNYESKIPANISGSNKIYSAATLQDGSGVVIVSYPKQTVLSVIKGFLTGYGALLIEFYVFIVLIIFLLLRSMRKKRREDV